METAVNREEVEVEGVGRSSSRVLEIAVKGNDFLESDDVKGKELDSFGW